MAIVGIDLGTYDSAIAYVNKHGAVEVIPNAEGDLFTPSIAFFDGDQIIVGKVAKQNVILESQNVIAFIKRQMGRPDYYFEHNGKRYSPTDISSFILRKLKNDAEAYLHEPVDETVIAVPAHFGQAQRRMTEEAAALAGLKVKQIVNEPTAAALAYGVENLKRDHEILVYHLGGGTFDVTILKIEESGFTVVNHEGDPWLGGKDWDDRIIQFVVEQFRAQHGENPLEDLQTYQALQDNAENAKMILSRRSSVKINCSYNGKTVVVELTREKFEELTEDLLDRTVMLVSQAMNSAGLTGQVPVLMVGGACNMPMVERRLRSISEGEPRKPRSLDLAVVTGAALVAQASRLTELNAAAEPTEDWALGAPIPTDEGAIVFFDVLNKSIGVEALDPATGRLVIRKVLEKNSKLGESTTQLFHTAQPNQVRFAIKVYEGESADPQFCTYLGVVELTGLPPGRPAHQPILVTFTSTNSGMLKVNAVDVNSAIGVDADLGRVFRGHVVGASPITTGKPEAPVVLRMADGTTVRIVPDASTAEIEKRKTELKEASTTEAIRCHTDVSFPAKVPVGKTYNLRVQIVPAEVELQTGEIKPTPKPHPHDVTMTLEVPKPTKPEEPPPPVVVTVSVAAENFESQAETRGEIIVPLLGKSDVINFRLRGQSIGQGRIMVDFAQDGRPVGSVDLYPEVVAADQREAEEQARGRGEVALSTHPRFAPDLIIKVLEFRHANEPGRLHFVLSSTHPKLKDLPVMDGDLGTVDLRSEVSSWVESQFRTLGVMARRSDSEPHDVHRTLSDLGNKLYDQLLPEKLKKYCWTFGERGMRTMLILSDEPHIPWELIKPYQADPVTGAFQKEGEFWGEAYAVTHWLRGRPPVEELSLRRVFAVAAGGAPVSSQETEGVRDFIPESPAPRAEGQPHDTSGADRRNLVDEELAILRSLKAKGAHVTVLPARMRELREAFERGGFDLLHVASHGAFGGSASADASAVLMEDGVFGLAELSPRTAGAMRAGSPLIFFNACHSGRIGFSLTRLGSWGAQFVELGCGGFIGSLWPVTDEAAVAFTRAFYDTLSRETSIGEAVLQARLAVRNLYPNDPTWMAYCCFADPMARVREDKTQARAY